MKHKLSGCKSCDLMHLGRQERCCGGGRNYTTWRVRLGTHLSHAHTFISYSYHITALVSQ